MVEVIINGHAGRLEGRYHQAKRPDAPVALILHPHPQYGGTMNNKVAYALFTCFRDLGFSVLRFNFRGVGRSQGEFEDGRASFRTQRLRWTGCRRRTPTRGSAGLRDIRSGRGSGCSC